MLRSDDVASDVDDVASDDEYIKFSYVIIKIYFGRLLITLIIVHNKHFRKNFVKNCFKFYRKPNKGSYS